ncbi:MAG TPA: hypothetical protein VGN63_12330 [Flavisolibacter sp.]|jgi:hypothetical protein|nr:hypothetical protein [Flavisolibacter sp.]
MELDPRYLDTQALKALYDKQYAELSDALLNGVAWKDVQDKRSVLIALTRQLYQRGIDHPAASRNRIT